MGLTRTGAPAVEPLTVAEVERHLRLDESMKEPVPDAPTVARVSPALAGDLTAGAYRYRCTFVTADGETDGGDVSGAVTIMDPAVNGRVLVSTIPLGGGRVTARRIYRTVADGAAYLLVATIADNTTTTYTDNIADGALGAGIPAANTTSDPEIAGMIEAAREWAEGETGRALITQTWRLALDCFPADGIISLPRPNLLTVESITYLDDAGALQTLAADQYDVDTAALPGRVLLAYDCTWPITRAHPNAVTVTYTAGYGAAAAAVPMDIRRAMLLQIGDMYLVREATIVGVSAAPNPAALALLSRHRLRLA